MHPDFVEGILVVGSILVLAFSAKYMIWGRGPIWRRGLPSSDQAVRERMVEIEERLEEQLNDYVIHHDRRITELEERVDFAERLLTIRSQGEPKAQDESKIQTPV